MAKAKRYTTSDALASAFQSSLGASFCSQPKNIQFGIIINKPFISKGETITIATKFDCEGNESLGGHIVNLILRRLCEQSVPTVEI